MKINVKFMVMTLLIFGLVRCEVKQDKTDELFFTGTLKGYGDGIIKISYNDPYEIMKDSIVVTDDKFKFNRALSSPRFAFLKIMGNENLKREYYRIDFFMEASDINLQLDIIDPQSFTINGSKTNVEYKKINDETREANQAYIKARGALRNKGMDSIMKVNADKKYGQESQKYLKTLNNNKLFYNSHAGPYKLWLLSRYLPLKDLEPFLPKFYANLQNNVYLSYLTQKRDAEQRVEPGMMAPDFKLKDLSGKEYTLKDFRGNYLLMDFEASWCKPCKLEIPFLKESHEKYAAKGLAIISVNLDKTRELWIKDKTTENLPWKMISDLNAFDGELTKNYSVNAIPRIFLIDPESKIVSSKLRQQRILDKLEEIYGE